MDKKLLKNEILKLSIPATRARQPPDAINLGPGDPDFRTPKHIIKAAYKAMLNDKTHYDFSSGLPEIREAISNYLKRLEIKADPNRNVLVTSGGYEAEFRSISAFINPGDEVIVTEPRYSGYDPQILFSGGKIIPSPLIEKRKRIGAFRPDVEDIKKKITPKTKIILIAQPDNPTGLVYNDKELAEISELAKGKNLIVISDEVYQEYIWGRRKHKSIYMLPGMQERTLIQMSFSKTFGMTGWRLGAIVSDEEIIQSLNLIPCSIRPPPFVQLAGAAALNGPWTPVLKMRREYKKRMRYVVKRLNEIPGIFCPTPEATFYLFPNIKDLKMPSSKFCEYIAKEAKISVSPGIGFGMMGEGHFRLSLVKPMEVLEKAMDGLEKAVKNIK